MLARLRLDPTKWTQPIGLLVEGGVQDPSGPPGTIDPVRRFRLLGKVDYVHCALGRLTGIHQAAALGQVAELDAGAVDEITLPVTVGDRGQATSYVAIVSDLPGREGIAVWSLSLGVSGEILPIEATVDGTVGAHVDDIPPGLRNAGFEATHIVDPDVLHPDTGEPQGPGVVSAVVLSMVPEDPITLEPVGTSTVLKIKVEAAHNQRAGESITGKISWREGMTGPGQPVSNVLTWLGSSYGFCTCKTLKVGFIPLPDLTDHPFVRGDVSLDGTMDISDAVRIFEHLFLGGRKLGCVKAADLNTDKQLDLSDGVFILQFLFSGGPAPNPPSGACGQEPSGMSSELTCEEPSHC